MASGPITSWQIDGETMETVRDFIFSGSKITADGKRSHEIKRYLLLGRKDDQQHIKKQRRYFANKGPSSQSYGGGNGNPHQYSCLENPMDGGAWLAAVHRVAKSRARLSDFPFTFHFHALEKAMATHSSTLAWRIPGKEQPSGLPSMGSHSRTRLKRLSSSSSSQSYGFSSMYGCESWTIKKAEHWRTDTFELWCWGRLLRIPWTARRLYQSILKEISPEYSLEGLMLKLKLQ